MVKLLNYAPVAWRIGNNLKKVMCCPNDLDNIHDFGHKKTIVEKIRDIIDGKELGDPHILKLVRTRKTTNDKIYFCKTCRNVCLKKSGRRTQEGQTGLDDFLE